MAQNPDLLAHAKQMRHEATPFEVILWRHLSRSRLGGHKFRRQHVVNDYIVDFFCPAKGLIVEVDGDTHDAQKDKQRDQLLSREGLNVLRFTNVDVRDNLDAVLATILGMIEETPSRWANSQPHPNPSPEGEGLRL